MSDCVRNTRTANNESELAGDVAHDENEGDNLNLDTEDNDNELDEDPDEDDIDDDEDLDDEIERNCANKFKRFVHFLVDQIASFLIARFVFSVMRASGQRIGNDAGVLWCLLISACYYLFFEAVFARTLGKLLTGTRVVAEDGQRADFGQLVKRTLCRFLPFEPLSFVLGGEWHDRLSRTYVVNNRGNDDKDG